MRLLDEIGSEKGNFYKIRTAFNSGEIEDGLRYMTPASPTPAKNPFLEFLYGTIDCKFYILSQKP
jgi:hypothetical protein